MTKEPTTKEKFMATFSGGPLDGTRSAQVIADTCPEANQEARYEDWRRDLHARTRAHMKRNQ